MHSIIILNGQDFSAPIKVPNKLKLFSEKKEKILWISFNSTKHYVTVVYHAFSCPKISYSSKFPWILHFLSSTSFTPCEKTSFGVSFENQLETSLRRLNWFPKDVSETKTSCVYWVIFVFSPSAYLKMNVNTSMR